VLNQKGFSHIILISLVLASLILFFGYYFFSSGLQTSSKNEEIKPLPSSTPLQKEDDVNSWNDYLSAQKYFTFKYPNNVKVLLDDRKLPPDYVYSINVQPDFLEENGQPLVEGRDNEIFILNISVRKNPKHLTTEDLKAQLKELSKKKSFPGGPDYSYLKDVEISYKNNQIVGIEYIIPQDVFGPVMITQVYKDNIYEFWYSGGYGGEVSEKSKQLIDKILSTLSFSD